MKQVNAFHRVVIAFDRAVIFFCKKFVDQRFRLFVCIEREFAEFQERAGCYLGVVFRYFGRIGFGQAAAQCPIVTVQPQAGCMGLPAKALRNTSSMP